MANFGQLLLTNKGLQAQYEAQAGGELKFNRIAMGSGNFTGNVMALTKLVTENVSVNISKGYVQNSNFVVEGFFSNESLQTGFAWREIGVFVEDSSGNEVLYCYANAGNTYDFIPATADERYSKYIRVAMAIGNATNVTIVEQEGILYVDTVTFNTAIEELRTDVDQLWPSKEVSGKVVAVGDSANQPFASLNLYGKSTQDGTPTPDAPVEIVSVENPVVTVAGKNLVAYPYKTTTVTANGLSFTDNGDGSITVNGTATTTTFFQLADIPRFVGNLMVSGCPSNGAYSTYQLAVDKNGAWCANDYGSGVSVECNGEDIYSLAITIRKDTTVSNLTFYPCAQVGEKITEYEPYKDTQTVELTHTLHGIPVSSGGNYTDADGQQWVCDEVDLERGVYVKRIGCVILDGSADEEWEATSAQYHISLLDKRNNRVQVDNALWCSHFKVPTTIDNSQGFVTETYWKSGNRNVLFNYDDGIGGLDNFKSWLQNNHVALQYLLNTPIETALSETEIAAYRALHSNYLSTTVLNDAGAEMKVQYITKTFDDALAAGKKMKGNIDMDGHAITGLPDPVNDTDAVSKGYLASLATLTPLWEKDGKSVSYSSGKIEFDTSPYKFFLVVFRVDAYTAYRNITCVASNIATAAGTVTYNEAFAYGNYPVTKALFYRRLFLVESDGIKFFKANKALPIATGYDIEETDTALVPWFIYGLR